MTFTCDKILLDCGIVTFKSPVMLFPFVLFDAVEQTAGDEGNRHEEDYGQAYDGCQHRHTETIVLIGRQSWSEREEDC